GAALLKCPCMTIKNEGVESGTSSAPSVITRLACSRVPDAYRILVGLGSPNEVATSLASEETSLAVKGWEDHRVAALGLATGNGATYGPVCGPGPITDE